MDRVLRVVDVRDEVTDAALVMELDRLAVGALVDELDVEPLREEGGLAEALRNRAGLDVELLEDLGVGEEPDRRAGRLVGLHLPDGLHVARRLAALELLAVDVAVAAHLGDETLGERVHDRDADAVEAAGDLVAVTAELAAGVELRKYDRERRQALFLHQVDRDARAPILDRDGMVRMEGHFDPVVAALEGFVDGVVDHLIDEVMEAAETGRTDVHPGPEPDRLEAFQDRDVLSGVVCFSHEKSPANAGFAG